MSERASDGDLAAPEGPCDGSKPRHLSASSLVRLGDGGEPARQHRLARARRAHQEHVVPARGRDLERSPSDSLPPHFVEIGAAPRARLVCSRRWNLWRGPRSPEESHDVGERPRRDHPEPVHHRCLGRVPGGTTTPSSPALEAASATERAPGVGTSDPSSESSPKNAYRSSRVRGAWPEAIRTHAARGGPNRVLLADVPGREVDDDSTQRPLQPGAPRPRDGCGLGRPGWWSRAGR